MTLANSLSVLLSQLRSVKFWRVLSRVTRRLAITRFTRILCNFSFKILLTQTNRDPLDSKLYIFPSSGKVQKSGHGRWSFSKTLLSSKLRRAKVRPLLLSIIGIRTRAEIQSYVFASRSGQDHLFSEESETWTSELHFFIFLKYRKWT